jgi:hypothetical protein
VALQAERQPLKLGTDENLAIHNLTESESLALGRLDFNLV